MFNITRPSPPSKPAGVGNNEVQYNSGGIFSASENYTYTDGSNIQNAELKVVPPGSGRMGCNFQLGQGAGIACAVNLGGSGGATISAADTLGNAGPLNLYGRAGNQSYQIGFWRHGESDDPQNVQLLGIGYNGNVNFIQGASTIALPEGNGACMQGNAVLVGGAATVVAVPILASSHVFVTSQVDGGTPGFLRVTNVVPGTGFTIQSSSVLDTSTVSYLITQKAPIY